MVETLSQVIILLNNVEVKGQDNLRYLWNAISILQQAVSSSKEDPYNDNITE